MTPFFSILSVQTNSYSQENVAVGLLVVADKVYFNYSIQKLNFLKKFDNGQGMYFLAVNNLNKITKSVSEKNTIAQTQLVQDIYSIDYFKYLNQYTAGAVTFSEPKKLNINFNDKVFAQYYQQMIGESLSLKKQKTINTFKSKINSLFKNYELDSKVDIDYTLKADKLSGVLKNTKVSLITVNGKISCLQTIDLTINKNSVINHLYETQIIFDGLNQFAKSHNKQIDKIKLAIEIPVDKKEKDFFDAIYTQKKEIFDFYEYDQVEKFTTTIAESDQYSKFSELLEK